MELFQLVSEGIEECVLECHERNVCRAFSYSKPQQDGAAQCVLAVHDETLTFTGDETSVYFERKM